MHVEDGAQAVTRVGLQVAAVAVLGALVEVVVLRDELLELRLHVDDLLGREVELDDGHARRLEVREEADFRRLQEHQGAPFAVGASCRAADAVDVVPWVVGRVKLHDPVYGWDLFS